MYTAQFALHSTVYNYIDMQYPGAYILRWSVQVASSMKALRAGLFQESRDEVHACSKL
jgi:hypothetical protein